METDLTWIEIDTKALVHNVRLLRKQVGKSVLLAPCVKGNAYGHGMVGVAKTLQKSGVVDRLCVNEVLELAALQRAGVALPIMVIGPIVNTDFSILANHSNCSVFAYDKKTITLLSAIGESTGKPIAIHVKVDTGMHRQGVLYEEFNEFLSWTDDQHGVMVEGIATHFATADGEHHNAVFDDQWKRFQTLREQIDPDSKKFIWHCANSAALWAYPETHMNMVRPGILTYGLSPFGAEMNSSDLQQKLDPAMCWKTRVSCVKKVSKDACISYGCTYGPHASMKVAVLPIGYFDGYDRGLSNKGWAVIRGNKCNIVGNVCMDMMMVDVTHIDQIAVGDEVELIGADVSASELADALGTINYEVVTRIQTEIPRVYV